MIRHRAVRRRAGTAEAAIRLARGRSWTGGRSVEHSRFLLYVQYVLQMESAGRAGLRRQHVPSPTPREQLIADCRDLAHQVFASVSRGSGPELLSLDLTMGQFKAMAVVTLFGPQPVGELGRRLGISEPAASLLADRLVELELAVRERDPLDRRRTLVTATPGAEELAARLRQGGREQFAARLAALDDEELECLVRGLRALLRVWHAADDAAEGAGRRVPAAAGGADVR
jgi:DNA-binding MarR family transcriptional regulator